MDKRELELNKLFNLEEWKKLLESLAEAMGCGIVMVDYKGSPVFDMINPCEFCIAINANPVGKKRCLKSVALGGLEAMRQNKPLISCCHAGLTIGVIPIMVDDFYMGAISFGQILLQGKTDDDRKNGILGERSRIEPGEKEELRKYLKELYSKVPVEEESRFVSRTNAMWNMMHYIVGRTVELKNERQTYEWVLQNALAPFLENQNIVPIASTSDVAKDKLPVSPSNQLYPAVKYVEDHPEEAIAMHKMAELCHLSHSYFSKLFFKETGENFSDYVCRRKIEQAKIRLRETGESVAVIAASLGFSDTSYFIKVFRKVEGITPLSYRQHKYLK